MIVKLVIVMRHKIRRMFVFMIDRISFFLNTMLSIRKIDNSS